MCLYWHVKAVQRANLLFKQSYQISTNNILGADSFLRSYLVLGWSTNFTHFKKPEGSSPCSQKPATILYSEPDESSPDLPILYFEDPYFPSEFDCQSSIKEFTQLLREFHAVHMCLRVDRVMSHLNPCHILTL